jgi:D-tagatose-1,6-bisphosphate aldolase subunit GatZ/KbaZ
VRTRAEELGADPDLVILAGDHLGPLTFADLPEEQAMQKAKELVYEYARAGFPKIHLDTSMKVADDPAGPLATGTVARRGKELYDVAMKAYRELLKEFPDAPRPVFVIGSKFRYRAAHRKRKTPLRSLSRKTLPIPSKHT